MSVSPALPRKHFSWRSISRGSAPRVARLAWSAPWSPPMSCLRWAVAGVRRFGHSLLVRQRNDRVRNRANGRGDRTHLATPKIHRPARTRRNMLSFSQLEFSLAPSVVEKPPGRDSALEALARDLLLQQGATTLAAQVRVEWSARLRTAAGRAECGAARDSAQPPSRRSRRG